MHPNILLFEWRVEPTSVRTLTLSRGEIRTAVYTVGAKRTRCAAHEYFNVGQSSLRKDSKSGHKSPCPRLHRTRTNSINTKKVARHSLGFKNESIGENVRAKDLVCVAVYKAASRAPMPTECKAMLALPPLKFTHLGALPRALRAPLF